MDKVKGTVQSNVGFYIGDICYILSDENYFKFWGEKHHYQDGVFKVPRTGFSFAVSATAHGDGFYEDNEGGEYPVDGGNIGLVPLELISKYHNESLGKVVKEPGRASFSEEGGVFTITLPKGRVVRIDTSEDW